MIDEIQDEKNRKNLYDALKDDYDLGTFEQFEKSMQSQDARKNLWDAIHDEYDVGSFEQFDGDMMGGDVALTDKTKPQQQQRSIQTTYQLARLNTKTQEQGNANQNNQSTKVGVASSMPPQATINTPQQQQSVMPLKDRQKLWTWRSIKPYLSQGQTEKQYIARFNNERANVEARNDPDEISEFNKFIDGLKTQQKNAREKGSAVVSTGNKPFASEQGAEVWPISFTRKDIPHNQDYVFTLRTMQSAKGTYDLQYNVKDPEIRRDYEVLTLTNDDTYRPTDAILDAPKNKKDTYYQWYAAYLYGNGGQMPSWLDYTDQLKLRAMSKEEINKASHNWVKLVETTRDKRKFRDSKSVADWLNNQYNYSGGESRVINGASYPYLVTSNGLIQTPLVQTTGRATIADNRRAYNDSLQSSEQSLANPANGDVYSTSNIINPERFWSNIPKWDELTTEQKSAYKDAMDYNNQMLKGQASLSYYSVGQGQDEETEYIKHNRKQMHEQYNMLTDREKTKAAIDQAKKLDEKLASIEPIIEPATHGNPTLGGNPVHQDEGIVALRNRLRKFISSAPRYLENRNYSAALQFWNGLTDLNGLTLGLLGVADAIALNNIANNPPQSIVDKFGSKANAQKVIATAIQLDNIAEEYRNKLDYYGTGHSLGILAQFGLQAGLPLFKATNAVGSVLTSGMRSLIKRGTVRYLPNTIARLGERELVQTTLAAGSRQALKDGGIGGAAGYLVGRIGLADGVSTIVGKAAQGSIEGVVLSVPHVITDVTNNRTGQANVVEINRDGIKVNDAPFTHLYQDTDDNVAKDALGREWAQWVGMRVGEVFMPWSKYVDGKIAGVGKAAWNKSIGKYIEGSSFARITDTFSRAANVGKAVSDVGKYVTNNLKRAGMGGTLTFYAQSNLSDMLNAMTVGDVSWDNIKSGQLDKLWGAFVSNAYLIAQNNLVGTVGYYRQKSSLNKSLAKYDAQGAAAWGDNDWTNIKSDVDKLLGNDKALRAYQHGIILNKNLSKPQRETISQYIATKLTLQAFDLFASTGNDNKRPNEFDIRYNDAYFAGTQVQSPDQMSQMRESLAASRNALSNLLGITPEKLDELSSNEDKSVGQIREALSQIKSPNSGIDAILNRAIDHYCTALAMQRGVSESLITSEHEAIQKLDAKVDGLTNNDSGMIERAVDDMGRECYVVSGNADSTNNTDMVVVRYVGDGRIASLSPKQLSVVERAYPNEVKQKNAESVKSEYEELRNGIINGKTLPEQGDKVVLFDGKNRNVVTIDDVKYREEPNTDKDGNKTTAYIPESIVVTAEDGHTIDLPIRTYRQWVRDGFKHDTDTYVHGQESAKGSTTDSEQKSQPLSDDQRVSINGVEYTIEHIDDNRVTLVDDSGNKLPWTRDALDKAINRGDAETIETQEDMSEQVSDVPTEQVSAKVELKVGDTYSDENGNEYTITSVDGDKVTAKNALGEEMSFDDGVFGGMVDSGLLKPNVDGSTTNKEQNVGSSQTTNESINNGTEPLVAEQTDTSQKEPMPMRTLQNGEKTEDWLSTTPQRGYNYLFNENGFSRDEAKGVLDAYLSEAQKRLDKEKQKVVKPIANVQAYKRMKEERDTRIAEAQKEVDYWNAVKAEHEKRELEEENAKQSQANDLTDNQGNPINEDGTLKVEKVKEHSETLQGDDKKNVEGNKNTEAIVDDADEVKNDVAEGEKSSGTGDVVPSQTDEAKTANGNINSPSTDKENDNADSNRQSKRAAEGKQPVSESTEPLSSGDRPYAEGAGNDAKSVGMRKAAERVAEKLGTKIVWDDSIDKSNGYYDPKTNTIHIAKDADNPLEAVFGHESLHKVRSLNEEAYQSLLNAVKQFVGEDAFNDAVRKKYDYYNEHGVKTSMDGAAEEVVADTIGQMLHDNEYAEELANKLEHPVLSAIKDFLKQMKNRIVKAFGGGSDEARKVDDLLKTIDKAYKKAVKNADRKPLKSGEDIRTEDGTIAAQVDEQLNVRPSLRTYNDWTDEHGVEHQGTRGRMVDFLTNKGFDKKDIDRMTEDMDYWHGLMQNVANFVDENGQFNFPAFHEWSESTPLYRKYEDSVTRAVSTLVNNGEYPLNFELTTDCIKREAFTQILNEMLTLDDAAWRKLSPAKISDIQTLEKGYGIQVACPLCFVEGKRLNIMKWATSVVNKWNKAVADVTGDKNTTPFGFGKGTHVPDKAMRDGDIDYNSDVVRQVNKVDRMINSREGVLPDVLQQMKQNDEELRQRLEQFRDEYAVKHGSIDGFTLTKAQEAELTKLRNKNLKSTTDRMSKAIAAHPELRHKLQVEDLVGSKGLMAIRTQDNPCFAEMYSLIVSANGTGTPKIVQDAQAYDGEILDVSDSKFDKASVVGGARLFSFSDFDLTKVFDIMQIMWDCAARDAKVQSYSKEVPYIVLFGKCGVKINMSMLPEARPADKLVNAYKKGKTKKDRDEALHAIKENSGLEMDNDGHIVGIQLSDSHSVSKEFAESIFHNDDYNANCGAIMVGISVNHTIYSMCQDYIRQVIPFHLSGMPIASRKKSDCIYYRDATAEQNTGYMVDGKRVKLIDAKGKSLNPKVDADFNFYEGEDQPGWNMRNRCRDYVKWCQENNCVPRFEYLVNSDAYRAFCEREGYKPNEEIIHMMDERTTDGIFDEYYKVITDYTAYQPIFDEKGNMIGERPAPHKAVSKDLNIDKNALSMVLGVDENGNMVDENSMLANRERSIANTDKNKREIAQKAVMILNGTAKVEDLVNKGGTEFENNSDSDKYLSEANVVKHSLRENSKPTKKEVTLRDALVDHMNGFGMDAQLDDKVGQRVLDMANERDVKLNAKQKRALETATMADESTSKATVVSSADGAKIQKNLETLVGNYENRPNKTRGFITDLSRSLGLVQHEASQYGTFETRNGKLVTIRVSNHNARVSFFDENGEDEGISIVISNHKNKELLNDGNAHIVEYFYPKQSLQKAEDKPLAEIIKSVSVALNSGKFEDTTGLAQRQEVNADMIREHRVYHGSGAEFDHFDHSHMGEGEGAQVYGWADHVRFFKTRNGEAYGFTIGGKIYIDPRIATSETPIHEYTHLWSTALKANNAKEWQNVVGLMKGTSVWNEVKKTYPELKTDDEIADEVLSTYSGRRGAERLRQEMDVIAHDNGNVFDKATAMNAMHRVKQAIDKFWKQVADFLHIHYTSAEQVADQVMKDLLSGVDPRSMMDGGKSLRPDTRINVVEGNAEHGFKNYAEAKNWAKENIVRTYNSEETGGKGDIRISNTAVDKYLSQSAVDKSDNKNVHLAVLKVLPNVIRESVDAEQHADFKKNVDGVRSEENGINPNVTIHRLYGAVSMDGKVYRVKVTLKEDLQNESLAKKAYSYEATKIELLAGTLGKPEDDAPNTNNSITAANLLKGVEKSYGGGKFFEGNDENGRVRYSLRENDEKTLAGVHNISEDKLRKALKLGGLANPSAAVIDTKKQEHNGYGGISLIMPSRMIENEKTFFGDAYTPRFPTVTKEMSTKGYKNLLRAVKELPEGMQSQMRIAYEVDYLENGNAESLAYWFLYDTDRNPETIGVDMRLSAQSDKSVQNATDNFSIGLDDLNKEQLNALISAYAEKAGKSVEDLLSEEQENRALCLEASNDESKPNVVRNIRKRYVDEIDKYGLIKSKLESIINDAKHDVYHQGEVDVNSTKERAIMEVRYEGLNDELNRWIDEKNLEFGVEDKLFQGYTYDGRRRYKKATLENISKEMKKQGLNDSESNWSNFHSFVASVLESVSGLDNIRAKKGNLTNDEDAFIDFEEWATTFSYLTKVLQGEGEQYGWDEGYERLKQIATKKDPQAYALSHYGIKLADSDAKDLKEMVNAIRNKPSRYFETKFERPVMLNEFAAAVVPKDLSTDVRKGLEEAGLKLYDYDTNVEGDRKRAFDEAVHGDDGMLFREGEPKALRGEEALSALDNIFNEPIHEILPSAISALDKFKEIFSHPIRTFLGELVKVKDDVFNKIIRERRSNISGAILSTIKNADFAIRDTDGSTLYVKRYKSNNSGNTYNVVAVNKHGEVEDYVSSVHIKRDGNLRNKIKNGAELLLPQERNTDGTLFRNNSTPTAKVEKSSESSLLSREIPKESVTAEDVNKSMQQAVKGVAEEMNVGNSVDVLTSTDGLTGRKAKAKGWYDPRTGRITIVLPNHASAEDVRSTIFHEATAHLGLRHLVGEENFNTFLDNIHNHAEKGIKTAIDELARTKYKGDTRKATEEYMASLAEDGEFKKPENQTFFNKVKSYLVDLLKEAGIDLGFELNDNDLRYILWRSWKNLSEGAARDIHQMAEDAMMQERLQQTPEAKQRHDEEVYFREVNDSIKDIVEKTKADLAKLNEDKRTHKTEAVKAIGGRLSELNKAMREQRAYDLHTVASITDLAKTMLKNGLLNNLSNKEASSLLSVVNNVHGKSDITNYVQKVLDLMVDNQVKNLNQAFTNLLLFKGKRVNAQGVEVQGKLDLDGQRMADVVWKNIGIADDALKERMDEAQVRMDSGNGIASKNASIDYAAYQIVKQYNEGIRDSKIEEQNLRDSLKQAKEDLDVGLMEHRDYIEFRDSVNQSIRDNRMERTEAYRDLIEKLGGALGESIEKAKEFRQAEIDRVNEIHHNANSDMEGRPAYGHHKPTTVDNAANNTLLSLLTAPLGTFDQMLRMFGNKNVKGEGYLWNRYMRGWTDARNNEIEGYRGALKELDDKVGELFGKGVKFADLFSIERKLPNGHVSFYDDGEKISHEIPQGNLLYIYMANKMADGKMKLRKMGISEADVEEIADFVDPRLKQLADWIQGEFLVKKRDKYNAVHERMFGASMADIDNYFPLKILNGAIPQNTEIEEKGHETNKASTTTGSIKKRTRNSLPLDIMNADAFSVLMEHIKEMEHWASFAEWNRDLNTLLSYKRFRTQVKNMSSVYGSGEKLLNHFENVCKIAAGVYDPKSTGLDKDAMNIAKGVTGAKVAFRAFTALKQLTSYPAFLSSANPIYLVENLAMPHKAWKWSMDNIPMLKERWQGRFAGDPLLMNNENDWALWRTKIAELSSRYGMAPNAFVDALTISMGTYAVYKTKKAMYLKMGYDEARAEQRAKQDATIAYNQTQQSSEGAFMSVIQSDRSWATALVTAFRNSSISYTRQLYDALRNIKRLSTHGYKGITEEFMTKQMERDGIDPNKASDYAKREYRKAWVTDFVRVGVYGYLMQLCWNLVGYAPYLIFGDDKDKKKNMWSDIYTHSLLGSIEGLTLGDVWSSGGNSMLRSALFDEEFNKDNFSKDMPVVSDINKMFQDFKGKGWQVGMSDVLNILVQSGFGTNPQTLTDAAVAVYDYCGQDEKTAKECALMIMRIMNCPESQMKQIYFDEIDATGEQASKMTPSEIAERYAKYKMRKDAPFTSFMYSDDTKDEILSKDRHQVTDAAKGKITEKVQTEETKRLFNEYDQMKKKVNAINELQYTDAEEYGRKMKELSETSEFKRYLYVAKFKGLSTKLSNQMLRSKNASERKKLYDILVNQRDKMLEEVSKIK